VGVARGADAGAVRDAPGVGTMFESPSLSIVTTRPISLRDYAKPMAACAASHVEHVVRANSRASASGDGGGSGGGGGVDVFAHSWNPELGRFYDEQYAPYLRASLHEPFEFDGKEKSRSQALSLGRAASLMGEHERSRGASRRRTRCASCCARTCSSARRSTCDASTQRAFGSPSIAA